MTPKLVIATPVGGAELWSAQVSVGYAESVRALSKEMPIEAVVDFSDDVVRSRNRVSAIVLRDFPASTHVLWWDSDEWPEDRRIVGEMIATGEHVIGAPYTNKKQPMRWVHQPSPGATVDANGCIDARAVGFGFTITTTECLRRMTAAARIYTDWPNRQRVANLFGQLYEAPVPGGPEEDDMLLSEDFSFCRRWRDLLGRVAIYTRAGIIRHVGQHAWSAHEMPGGVVGRAAE